MALIGPFIMNPFVMGIFMLERGARAFFAALAEHSRRFTNLGACEPRSGAWARPEAWKLPVFLRCYQRKPKRLAFHADRCSG
jgi:hypothetical protein